MPGVALLRKATKAGPRAVLDLEMKPGRTWFSPATIEVRNSFMEHMKQAFPSQSQEWKQFRRTVAEYGMKSYVARRMFDEMFQWDTIADGLTLVEMYQGGAGWRDYGYFVGVNLASRIHWGVGPMIQAVSIHDQDEREATKKAKELGKSLVFMTLARVVPWAASAKITFDIMRGTVVVTVGWAVNEANRATIDAVYTGEAGRTDPTAAGTKRGSLRDSQSCILKAEHVRRLKDPKTGKLIIAVDRNALYEHFFQKWTGSEANAVPRSLLPRGDAARFVQAHDAFVRVLFRQAEQFGPTWVQTPDKPFLPLRLTQKEVEVAIRALEPFLRQHATKEADRVTSEAALRSYRSYMDAEGADVIHAGLVNRFSADLLGGLIEHWHVRITAQVLAARNIERVAVYQDLRAIAAQLHKKYVPSPDRVAPLEIRLQGGRWRAVKRPPGERAFVPVDATAASALGLSFKLDARVDGVPVLGGMAVDGSQPVRVSALLHGMGELSDVEKRIKIEVETAKLKKAPKKGEDNAEGPVGPGDVVEDVITVRAMAADGAGPELARVDLPLRILLPEDSGKRGVPLWRRKEHRRNGSLHERFTFVRTFAGMPQGWKTEYAGMVLHGDYETYLGDGKTIGEIRRYHFGVLHGKVESFDSKGRLVHVVPYKNGIVHGDDIRYEVDGPGRLICRYENSWLAEKYATNSKGQPLVRIKYEQVEGETFRTGMSGEATRWWMNGTVRWQGRYEKTWQDLNSLGGPDGGAIVGKAGTWEWFFEDGALAMRAVYAKGVRNGPYEGWDFVFAQGWPDVTRDRPVKQGDVRFVGSFAEGQNAGTRKSYDWEGRPLGSTFYEAGEAVRGERIAWHESGKKSYQGHWTKDGDEGLCESFFETGKLDEAVTWRRGHREGPYKDHHENGRVYEVGQYANGEQHGMWEVLNDDGTLWRKGAFVAGVRVGPWKEAYSGSEGLFEEGNYNKAGQRHGRWTSWDGRAPLVVTYKDGKVLKIENK